MLLVADLAVNKIAGNNQLVCPQHVARPRNLLPRNMLRLYKRGFTAPLSLVKWRLTMMMKKKYSLIHLFYSFFITTVAAQCKIQIAHNVASELSFCTFWPCDVDLWPFLEILIIGGRGNVMDFLSAKFGDCILQPFCFYHADKHTQRESNATKRLSHATVVGVSKIYDKQKIKKCASNKN